MTLWHSILSEVRRHRPWCAGTLGPGMHGCRPARGYAAVIDRAGVTVKTPRGPKEHPLLRHELQTRAYMTRALNRLLPDQSARSVGRPTDQGADDWPERMADFAARARGGE
jgi:hypothetical protein